MERIDIADVFFRGTGNLPASLGCNSYGIFWFAGNANLLIGVVAGANQEIGVPEFTITFCMPACCFLSFSRHYGI